MKLFNKLRKRIVYKLIRPEDGYIYTGNSVRFYHDIYDDQYVLYVGNTYVFPTLAGWKEYDGNETDLTEIDFFMWKIGILDNINDQYMERLDNLSKQDLKSLRDYFRYNGDEKFVITKKSFCDVISALESYWCNLRALEGILNVYFEEGMMTDIVDKVVEALEEELEPQFYDPEFYFDIDEDPIIMRWLTGTESDRTVNGTLLATAEDLYDYLIEKRNEKNISENA